MARVPFCSVLQSLVLYFATFAVASKSLQDGFQNPRSHYRPKFFYWYPDASVPTESLRDDVRSIASIGGDGITFLPHYLFGMPIGEIEPPTNRSEYGYGTPAYQDSFRAILEEAKINGLHVDVGLGGSQGQGNPAPVGSKGLAVHLLAGNVTLEPGERFDGDVPPPSELSEEVRDGHFYQFPTQDFGGNNLTATIAIEIINSTTEDGEPIWYINEDSIIDLSDEVTDGKISWTAPEGDSDWRLFTFWEAFTNQRSIKPVIGASDLLGNGSWVVDHFSQDGARMMADFVEQNVLSDEAISSLVREHNSKGFEDSIEILSVVWWTPGLLEKFEQSKGYSLAKYLPLIYTKFNHFRQEYAPYHEEYVYGSYAGNHSLYNLDYLSVLTECYGEFLQTLTDWSHEVGMAYSAQTAYNLRLDMSASIPHVDMPQTESVAFLDIIDSYKEFSGPAHMSGKEVISSELGAMFTAYTQDIPTLLWQAKRSWAGGVNDFVIHGSPYSGDYEGTTWPGLQALFMIATENWNRHQPAWKHFSDFTGFMGRMNMILQQGKPKVDLAFYLHQAAFVQGEPNLDWTDFLDKGYTYEYLGPSNFDLPLAEVKDKSLAPDGPGYRALVFYNQIGISSAAASKVLSYAESGLPIFFVGDAPKFALSAVSEEQDKVKQLMADILDGQHDSVFQVADEEELLAILEREEILPQTTMDCSESPVYATWRSDGNTGNDYVYIYNDGSETTCDLTFTSSQSDKPTPYILNAWTGDISPLPDYTNPATHQIATTITLQGNETMLLQLSRDSHSCNPTTRNPTTAKTSSRSAPISLDIWDLELTSYHGPSPNTSAADVLFHVKTHTTTHNLTSIKLEPWSRLDSSLANVSGLATYRTTFPCAPELVEEYASSSDSSSSGSGSTLRRRRHGAVLELPKARHTLRASLNGQRLPPLDPVKPVADLTPYLRCGSNDENDKDAENEGENELEVEISTRLFNAVKAEIETALFMGMPLAELDESYGEAEFVEEGLVGEVWVEWVEWPDAE